MRKKIGLFAAISTFLLICIAFAGVVEAESIQQQSTSAFGTFLEDISDWFPGFLLVQLLKGVLALIMVLLILFDLIDPEETL